MNITQVVTLKTNDEWNGRVVTVSAIKPYGFEIVEDGMAADEKMLFRFDEIRDTSGPRNDPPTQKQIDRLRDLGYKGQPATKGEASALIDQLTPACHYCGQPATSFGFFDEAVCRQCGA